MSTSVLFSKSAIVLYFGAAILLFLFNYFTDGGAIGYFVPIWLAVTGFGVSLYVIRNTNNES